MKVTMMDAALKYAEANIPVMPLHWICEDGSCSCKKGQQCDSKGKHPLYTGWYKNSTSDIEQIRKWWTKTPNANIGIPTGAENNARCNPPLDEEEVKTIAHSVSRYQPNPPAKKYYHRTDSGNAERMRDRFGSIIRYCPAF